MYINIYTHIKNMEGTSTLLYEFMQSKSLGRALKSLTFPFLPILQSIWCCYTADIFPQHANTICSQGALWMCHLRQDLAGPCRGMENCKTASKYLLTFDQQLQLWKEDRSGFKFITDFECKGFQCMNCSCLIFLQL